MDNTILNNLKNPSLRRYEGENYELKVFKGLLEKFQPKGIWLARKKCNLPNDVEDLLHELEYKTNYAVDIYFLDNLGYHPVQVKISDTEIRPDLTTFLEFINNKEVKKLIKSPYYIYYEGKYKGFSEFFRHHEDIKILTKEDLELDSLENSFNNLSLNNVLVLSPEQMEKVQQIIKLLKFNKSIFSWDNLLFL